MMDITQLASRSATPINQPVISERKFKIAVKISFALLSCGMIAGLPYQDGKSVGLTPSRLVKKFSNGVERRFHAAPKSKLDELALPAVPPAGVGLIEYAIAMNDGDENKAMATIDTMVILLTRTFISSVYHHDNFLIASSIRVIDSSLPSTVMISMGSGDDC
jgi:hypothetical protein